MVTFFRKQYDIITFNYFMYSSSIGNRPSIFISQITVNINIENLSVNQLLQNIQYASDVFV